MSGSTRHLLSRQILISLLFIITGIELLKLKQCCILQFSNAFTKIKTTNIKRTAYIPCNDVNYIIKSTHTNFSEYEVGIVKRRRDTMFDQAAYFIFRALLILTVLVVVVGIPLGETLIRKIGCI